MKNSLLTISLLLFHLLGYTQTEKNNPSVIFSDTVLEDSFFVSQAIAIQIDPTAPFGYLSAYSETHSFQGAIYQRHKIAETWSDWQKMNLVPTDENSDRIVFQGLSIPTEVEAIQFKTSELIDTPFKYRLYNPGISEEKPLRHSTSRNKGISCERPTICDRACWCPDGNCPTDQTPVSTTVTHIIIHHSAANTRSNDFPAVIRSIWDFHANTRGWDDIGYNWLIDANGVIYEGRGEERLGAHFSCMNEETVGICLIGNFEEDKPTEAALEALQQFVAWEAHKGSIDITTKGYHASAQIELDFLAGHSDGGASPLACSSTICPGENLYNELPLLRSAIAAMPCMAIEDSIEVLTNINELEFMKDMQVFPNPSNGEFSLSFYAEEDIQASLSLISANGQSVNLGKRNAQQGDNLLFFSIPFIAPGIYYLRANGAAISEQEQVVIID